MNNTIVKINIPLTTNYNLNIEDRKFTVNEVKNILEQEDINFDKNNFSLYNGELSDINSLQELKDDEYIDKYRNIIIINKKYIDEYNKLKIENIELKTKLEQTEKELREFNLCCNIKDNYIDNCNSLSVSTDSLINEKIPSPITPDIIEELNNINNTIINIKNNLNTMKDTFDNNMINMNIKESDFEIEVIVLD